MFCDIYNCNFICVLLKKLIFHRFRLYVFFVGPFEKRITGVFHWILFHWKPWCSKIKYLHLWKQSDQYEKIQKTDSSSLHFFSAFVQFTFQPSFINKDNCRLHICLFCPWYTWNQTRPLSIFAILPPTKEA